MLEAYVQYWRLNLLTMLEYRANFVMWFFFTIMYHGVALAALYVTMRQFPSMNGWDFRQMFFLYALWMAGHELHNTLFFTIGPPTAAPSLFWMFLGFFPFGVWTRAFWASSDASVW